MIIWSIFWGVVLGWLWPGYGPANIFLGALFGVAAGISLRWAVRAELQTVRATQPAPAVSGSHSARPVAEEGRDLAGFRDGSRPVVAQQAGRASSYPISGAVAAAGSEEASADRSGPLGTGQLPGQPLSAAVAKAPLQPARPDAVELAILAVKNWLLGGNTIVRAGLVILFIGLSFLARYAASAGLLPVEFRLGTIGAAAIALLGVGFRVRDKKPGFALALQGAGVAVMYLTVFAAFRLYGLLEPLPAFGLMIVVCALSCALALLQDSRALAVAAFAGGFAVPLLLSTGQGSHIGLFSYYTVLNLAILFIAYKRSWRILNAVGFVATFGVATAWGVLKYVPAQYASSQAFLLAFVLMYLFTAILYARNTPTRLGNAVDTMLVFGTPLAGFGLQAGLVRGMELGTAFSALGFAAIYLVTAMLLMRRALGNYRLLIECLIAVGVGFATLAVPLALDAQWTSAVWALEGAGAFWVGKRQARWMPRAFGLLLQGVAALAFLGGHQLASISALPLLNPAFLGAMLIALPAFGLAWWLRQPLAHSGSSWARGYAAVEVRLSSPAYLFGFAFWCLALVLEMMRRVPGTELGLIPAPVFSQSNAQLLVMLALVASAALSMQLGLKTRWPAATWPARFTLLAMAACFAFQWFIGHRVSGTPAWAVWLVVLLMHCWMLRQSDRLAAMPADIKRPAPFRILHAGTAWLVTLLLADCLWSGITRAELSHTSWSGVVLLVSAIAVLMLLATVAGKANRQAGRAAFRWPLNPHAEAYYWNAALPLALLVFFGALVAAVHSSGHTEPLPYIPLLNPTDLTLALALGALVFWRRVLLAAAPAPVKAGWVTGRFAAVALALLAFVAVNTVWLRIAHHYFAIQWNYRVLFGSFVVQTGYAVLWSLLALTLMLLAHRRAQRPLWLVGSGLLGLVVVKLLLIDLSNAGGAERIIAFIGVGVLMLAVGYFAPLPPRLSTSVPRGALPAGALS